MATTLRPRTRTRCRKPRGPIHISLERRYPHVADGPNSHPVLRVAWDMSVSPQAPASSRCGERPARHYSGRVSGHATLTSSRARGNRRAANPTATASLLRPRPSRSDDRRVRLRVGGRLRPAPIDRHGRAACPAPRPRVTRRHLAAITLAAASSAPGPWEMASAFSPASMAPSVPIIECPDTWPI